MQSRPVATVAELWSAARGRPVVVLCCLTVTLVAATTGGSLNDPDVWWHVRTGRHILDTKSIPSSDPWSFTAPNGSWVPTAWLSDVVFAGVWHLGGYEGLRLLRIALSVMVVAALLLLARSTVGFTTSSLMGVAVVAIALQPFLKERPAILSFLFAAVLSWQAQQILDGRVPRLLPWTGLVWLWANVHGTWAMAPLLLLLAGVAAWISDRSRVQLAARCSLIAITATAAVALTPVGPRLVVWPFVVRDVARPITEWLPPTPLAAPGFPFTVLLFLIAASWWAGNRVSAGRLLYVTAVGIFGYSATRMIAPAAILLLPELARALATLLAGRQAAQPSFSRWAGSTLVLSTLFPLLVFLMTPTYAHGLPLTIIEELRTRPDDVRVLNHYNVGGLITGLAAPPAQVGIDGRTDIWSAEYVREYLLATSGETDWRPLVDHLDPTVAVLPAGNQVAEGLVRERGWRVLLRDHEWQLLEHP